MFLISVNIGTIGLLTKMFRDNEDVLVRAEADELLIFEQQLDTRVHELMYQNAIHYSFYHEMAHLIQMSDEQSISYQEELNNSAEYSRLRHNLEFDADEFSALSMGSHLVQYARLMFREEVNAGQIENLICVLACSILFYLLSFPSNRDELYFESRTHPHPAIRLTFMIYVITSYCQEALDNLELNVQINQQRTIYDSLSLASRLAPYMLEEPLVVNYLDRLNEHGRDIINYINETKQERSLCPRYAVNRRNVYARSLHG